MSTVSDAAAALLRPLFGVSISHAANDEGRLQARTRIELTCVGRRTPAKLPHLPEEVLDRPPHSMGGQP